MVKRKFKVGDRVRWSVTNGNAWTKGAITGTEGGGDVLYQIRADDGLFGEVPENIHKGDVVEAIDD